MTMLYLSMVLRPALPTFIYYTQQDYFAKELCRFKDVPKSCCKGSCQIGRMAKETHGENLPNSLSRMFAQELIVVLPASSARALPDIAPYQKHALELNMPLSSGKGRDIWHPPSAQA